MSLFVLLALSGCCLLFRVLVVLPVPLVELLLLV
jgi:hypothetical protein